MATSVRFWCMFVTLVTTASVQAVNYDESKIPAYELPPLLPAGTTDRAAWEGTVRPQWIKTLNDDFYGAPMPADLPPATFAVGEPVTVLDGLGIRQLIEVYLAGPGSTSMTMMLYLPRQTDGPVPTFVMPNFSGNQTVELDPAIPISHGWAGPNKKGVENNRWTEESRGTAASRWPLQLILAAGYGVATFHYCEVSPDRKEDSWGEGIYEWCDRKKIDHPKSAVAAWAWAMSRVVDYLVTDARIDKTAIIAAGHSRLGKTALLAGVREPRFAAVISNNSGCCGAALSRREFGETLADACRNFPQWFTPEFQQYAGKESALPFDQHVVLACIAPRPLLISSAEDDRWADPRGEFLAAQAASPIYNLYGLTGLEGKSFPDPTPDQLYNHAVSYHYRPGKHDVTSDDWRAYILFADTQLHRKK